MRLRDWSLTSIASAPMGFELIGAQAPEMAAMMLEPLSDFDRINRS
jgi:hypothetical protein